MPPRKTTRRKPVTKDSHIHVRVTDDQLKQIDARAAAEHLERSVWVRQVILRALERPEAARRGDA